MQGPETITWRKSVRSGGENNCVEVAQVAPRTIGLRDSKNVAIGHIDVEPATFRTLLTEVRSGKFDLPAN